MSGSCPDGTAATAPAGAVAAVPPGQEHGSGGRGVFANKFLEGVFEGFFEGFFDLGKFFEEGTRTRLEESSKSTCRICFRM